MSARRVPWDAWATAAGVLLLAHLAAVRQEDERRRAPREETAHG